jgi:hypothetical protein
MVCSSCFMSLMFRLIVNSLSIVCLNLDQSVFLYVICVRVRFSRFCPSVVVVTGLWSESSAVIVMFFVIIRSIVVGLIPFPG